MSKQVLLFGISFMAVAAVAIGTTVYLNPDVAISAPSQIAQATEKPADPAPQRLQLVQAQTNGTAGGGTVPSGLPGGASSLNETYKDWQVSCVQQETAKRCVLSQTQAQQNGQRVLMIELNAPSGNNLSGTLVLPFGLALDSGLTFQIDEKPSMAPARFRTCLPAGCLVSLNFDTTTLGTLRTGTALKLKVFADGGSEAPLSISLQGFGTAVDRVTALSR